MQKDNPNKEIKKSNWLNDALYRRSNKKWLNYSSQIARRILAKIRDDEKLNQAELARILNVSSQQVSKIVKGQENLTLETIAKLSEALGVELISFPDYKYTLTTQSIGDWMTMGEPYHWGGIMLTEPVLGMKFFSQAVPIDPEKDDVILYIPTPKKSESLEFYKTS